jgi:hypothetical protein
MRILIGIVLAAVIGFIEAHAQNSAVSWSAFSMGLAVTASTTTGAQSTAGQLVVGSTQSANSGMQSGFIPGASGTLTGVASGSLEFLTSYSLEQNYPNPWNPSTTIQYNLPKASFVMLTVYNGIGQLISRLVNEQQAAGYHDVMFHGDGLASGIYFYRLQAGDYIATKKLILLR